MHKMFILRKIPFPTCQLFQSGYQRGLKTMQAWQALAFGGLEQLQLNTMAQMPVLTKKMDILVKVHASSINPLDVQMLNGYGTAAFNFVRRINECSITSACSTTHKDFPLVLGRDFSGTVVHVGKCVTNYKIGDEVWGAVSPWESGSHAEYVLASSCNISKKPQSLSHVEAASLPYAALTAWSAITTFGGLSENSACGKRVLIIGSSGGVGTFAIQLLKSWGADVTATCATDAVEMILNCGADTVLDYQSPDFKLNLKELKNMDLILDGVGEEYPELTVNLLKRGRNSKYITIVSPILKNTDDHGVLFGTFISGIQATLDTVMSLKDGRSFRWAYFIPNGCALKSIAHMIDKKQINPVIDDVYKFHNMLEAYEKVLKGHARGKTVLDYSSENST